MSYSEDLISFFLNFLLITIHFSNGSNIYVFLVQKIFIRKPPGTFQFVLNVANILFLNSINADVLTSIFSLLKLFFEKEITFLKSPSKKINKLNTWLVFAVIQFFKINLSLTVFFNNQNRSCASTCADITFSFFNLFFNFCIIE